MKAIVPVSLPDLLDAFEWVSSSTTLENLAYVSRSTGKTYITSREMDVGDELPDDIDDGREYVAVPHKNELNLGSHLAISFAENWLPESAEVVHAFFRQRGAYGRFKDLLERKACLDAWYQYEAQSVEKALREWCRANDIAVVN
jgi:hypothetical protein